MTRPGRQTIFLLLTAISSVGGAAALIAVAVISVGFADSPAQAGAETGLVLAVVLLASAIALPYAQLPAHRFGIHRTYVFALAAWATIFIALGAGIGLGLPPYWSILLMAPLAGICQGFVLALNQVVLRAYSPDARLEHSVAHYVAVSGIAVAVGSPVAGFLVDVFGPAWALSLNGASFLPLLFFVVFVRPRSPLGHAEPTRVSPWHSMVHQLRAQPRLRLLCAIGVIATVTFGPLSQLMVPLAYSLGYNLALHASLLMAALALGAAISPWVLRVQQATMQRIHPSRVHSSIGGYALAAVVMLAMALASALSHGTPKLVAELLMLVLLGGFSNAARSFTIAGIQSGRSKAESVLDLSTFYFAISLGMPVGALVWGQLIDSIGGAWALTLASGLSIVVLTALRQLFVNRPRFQQWAAPGTPSGS